MIEDSRVIATRQLDLVDQPGQTIQVSIGITAPYQDAEDDRIWHYDVQIAHPKVNMTSVNTGGDSLHALNAAINLLKLHLRGFKKIDRDTITFIGQDDLLLGLSD